MAIERQINEEQIIGIITGQFEQLLEVIEKYGISYNGKTNIYSTMQQILNEKIILDATRQGIKLGKEQAIADLNTKQNVAFDDLKINEPTEEKAPFNEVEETLINQYVDFYMQNGIDAPMKFAFEANERTLQLLQEARKRAINLQKSK